MFKAEKIVSDEFDMFSYIEDVDVFNSKFLYDLNAAGRYRYKVTENETRLDLVARQLYGSDGDVYYPILVMLNNKIVFDKNETIYYVSMATINSIIRKL